MSGPENFIETTEEQQSLFKIYEVQFEISVQKTPIRITGKEYHFVNRLGMLAKCFIPDPCPSFWEQPCIQEITRHVYQNVVPVHILDISSSMQGFKSYFQLYHTYKQLRTSLDYYSENCFIYMTGSNAVKAFDGSIEIALHLLAKSILQHQCHEIGGKNLILHQDLENIQQSSQPIRFLETEKDSSKFFGAYAVFKTS